MVKKFEKTFFLLKRLLIRLTVYFLILLKFFFYLAMTFCMPDPGFSTTDKTIPPAVETQSSNHWTSR